jgi:SAM-dependent methyltransferase
MRTRRSDPAKLRWRGDHYLEVGNASFLLSTDPAFEDTETKTDEFVLVKSRRLVEDLVEHAPKKAKNILDLGICKGGSIALCNELFSPKRLVGVDKRSERVDLLDKYAAKQSFPDAIRLHYDTFQDDPEALSSILRDDFRDEPLDLVVDDCSHMYEPTRVSLNYLFPRLRPGGVYVIEDWGWAHWPAKHWQETEHQFFAEVTPLSHLIFELVMVAASRPDLIWDIGIWHSATYVTRGDEIISDPAFDISKSYLTDGRRVLSDHPPR